MSESTRAENLAGERALREAADHFANLDMRNGDLIVVILRSLSVTFRVDGTINPPPSQG